MGKGADLIIRIATAGTKLAQSQLAGLGQQGRLLSGTMATLAKVGIGAFTVALIGATKGIIASVQAFAEFDDQLTQSLAIMKTTEMQQASMAMAARQVATETTISATDSAQAYFYLASAGLDAEQSIAALPQVAKFAQAGMFDMATATDLATDAQSALGLTVKNAEQNLINLTRVTDVLVKANTLANATVQQFSEALTTKAGAALKVVNKDIEEGVAVLAAFADRGVKGAEAGDKLNQVLRDIPRATAKNSAEFKALGLEMFDAEGNMKNVADIIEELDRVLGPMSDEMKAATLDQLGLNRGVADAVKILSGATDQIRNYENELRNAGGTTEEVAAKQLESFKAQVQILRNQIENLKITVGEDMVPALTEFTKQTQITVERLQNFKNRIGEVSERVKILASGLALAVTMAFGPVGIAIAGVTLGLIKLGKWLKGGNDAYAEATTKANQLNDAYKRQQYYLGFTAKKTEEVVQVTGSLEDVLDGTNYTVSELNRLLKENNITLDDNAKEALKTAQAYEDGLLGGLQSVLSAMDKLEAMQDRINNAEKSRNKAVQDKIKAEENQQQAINNLEQARADLAKVQGLGAKVTAEEQLAIERQKQAIAELEAQEDKSTIQKLELQVAQDRLAELIAESTALSREEEMAIKAVEQAEKDLVRADELVLEAKNNVREAQEKLNKVTEQSARNVLEQAMAQEELTKALASFGIGTKGYEDALKKLVSITGIELGKLNNMFDETFNKSIKIGLGADTSGGNGGAGGGGVKFPATGGTTGLSAERRADIMGRIGENNVTNINVTTGATLGTTTEIEDAVSRALTEAKRRGITVA